MNDLVYELDPKGDIFLVLDNVSHELPDNLRDMTTSSEWPNGLSNPTPPESDQSKGGEKSDEGGQGNEVDSTNIPECAPRRRLQIRASSKHLILASPQFERSLQDGFQEGTTLKATGCLEFPVRDWEAIPFLILMLIIHHRTRMVPRQVSLQRLMQIARLVDYYECYEAVEPFSDLWLVELNIKSGTPTSVDSAKCCLCISWVFDEAGAFKLASKYLESKSTCLISFDQHPVPRSIQDAINSSRRALILGVIESMRNIFTKLRDGPDQCSEECSCALLGALTRAMHRIGIPVTRPLFSYKGISFSQLAQNCRNIKTPENVCRKRGYYDRCDIYRKVDPLLRNIEKLNVGLDISKFAELRSPHT